MEGFISLQRKSEEDGGGKGRDGGTKSGILEDNICESTDSYCLRIIPGWVLDLGRLNGGLILFFVFVFFFTVFPSVWLLCTSVLPIFFRSLVPNKIDSNGRRTIKFKIGCK